MDLQNFIQKLQQQLTAKNQDHAIYRKASAILTSLIHATNKIPNFNQTYGGNNRALALYVSAGIYKLLKKVVQGDEQYEHNLDAYLLLLSMSLPETSSDALVQGGLIRQLKNSTLAVINRKTNTPFMTRLAVSILSHTLAPQMTKSNYKSGQDRNIILDLFEMAIATTRNNALSRQCSKLLVHLIKNNLSVCTILAEEAKNSLFSCLDDKRQLYFSNVKEVMIEMPVRFLNDICHKIVTNLAELDVTDPNQENYISQTYFFLQKMTTKLLAGTLQVILLVLVNAIPTGSQNDKIQLSYMQLLYEATLALSQSDENILNKLLSPIFSVMMEFLAVSGKISKFSGNLLAFMINNCIKASLWRKDEELSFERISLQQDNKNFEKVLYLFQSLLSSRFSNNNQSAVVISQFISKLQPDTLSNCTGFIQKVVDYRSQLGEKPFKKIFESLLVTFGIQHMLLLYPMNLNGDIASPQFQDQNNLWMLSSIEKTERFESMGIFYKYIMPLVHMCREYEGNTNLSKQRRQGYMLIEDLMWRCIKVFCKIYNKAINYDEVLNIVEMQVKKVNDSTLQQLSLAIEQLSIIIVNSKLKLQTAEQLIKTLASILDVTKNSSILILNAIKGLARIAPIDYVKRVFDKNIEKLIGLAEENSLMKEQQKNIKNLQILMAVNSSIDLRDPSVTTKYRISRQELLLRMINNLIGISGPFQKKGYKYLSQALNAAPTSFFLEILEVLQNSIKVDNSSKSHRLIVISKLWNWLKNEGLQENIEKIMGFIKTHLPEVMLSLREHNKGARNQGAKLMGQFTETMEEIGLIESFVEIVCIGLVGQRSEMKLATLVGIGVIIGKGFCTEQIFKEVLQIVLLLLKQKKQQIYKGVVQFCKRGILSQPLDKQALYLPTILQHLFEQDEEGKMQHISILRHFLLRLGKKHGRQTIQNLIPVQHRKMFSHAIKMQNREKRKKKQQNIARRQYFQRQKQQRLDRESSSDSEEADEEKKVQTGDMDIEHQDHLNQLDNTNNLLLKYDLEQQQFHFMKEKLNKPAAEKRSQKSPDQITFDSNGMMIIQERKRQRITQEQEKQEPFNLQSNNMLNIKKKAKVEVHTVKQSGQTYKSSRARGDIKLKDKPEPYAFIQFSSKALNKRFKKRAQQVFDNLFEKKEGGLRGLKSRITG